MQLKVYKNFHEGDWIGEWLSICFYCMSNFLLKTAFVLFSRGLYERSPKGTERLQNSHDWNPKLITWFSTKWPSYQAETFIHVMPLSTARLWLVYMGQKRHLAHRKKSLGEGEWFFKEKIPNCRFQNFLRGLPEMLLLFWLATCTRYWQILKGYICIETVVFYK